MNSRVTNPTAAPVISVNVWVPVFFRPVHAGILISVRLTDQPIRSGYWGGFGGGGWVYVVEGVGGVLDFCVKATARLQGQLSKHGA